MNKTLEQTKAAPVVRQYEIGGVRYIVKATVTNSAAEDAIAKINRLIKNDAGRENTAIQGVSDH